MNLCQLQMLVLFVLSSAISLLAQNAETNLIHDLLEGYINPSARPVRDQSSNVTVTLRLLLTQVIELSERRQEITISAWFNMDWKDEFLEWDANDYDNISSIYIKQSELWSPDITLDNNVDEKFERMRSSIMLLVKNDGQVTFSTPVILKSFCKMQLKYFPFDEQQCSLEFTSWIYNGDQVDVVPDTSSGSKQTEFNPNGAWNLKDVSTKYIQEKYNCCPEVYPKVIYTIFLKRRARFFVDLILLPCCLLSILTMFVFLLPPESCEKMSFGVSTLLAILLFQQMISEALPPSADHTPILQTYFTMVTCMCFISIVCSTLVLNIYNSSHASSVPVWLSRFIQGGIGKNRMNPSTYCNQYMQNEKHSIRGGDNSVGCTNNTKINTVCGNQTKQLFEISERRGNNRAILFSSNELKLILKEIQKYSNENKVDKIKSDTIHNWRSAAIFVDRILFLISFTVVTIVIITVILLISVQ